MSRLIFICALFCLIPVLPWWCLLLAAALGIIFFNHFWEAIALFFVYDLLFGMPSGGWLATQFSLTIAVIVGYLLLEGVKEYLRFYHL